VEDAGGIECTARDDDLFTRPQPDLTIVDHHNCPHALSIFDDDAFAPCASQDRQILACPHFGAQKRLFGRRPSAVLGIHKGLNTAYPERRLGVEVCVEGDAERFSGTDEEGGDFVKVGAVADFPFPVAAMELG
jgi:hypothetical protein